MLKIKFSKFDKNRKLLIGFVYFYLENQVDIRQGIANIDSLILEFF